MVKEIIIAKILGHNVITHKRQPDACDKINPYLMYEYLTCFDGGEGQIDRMFKEPDDKRAKSLLRITRNNKIYLAVFFLSSLKVKIIFEIEPSILVAETERQLDRSSNAISHVGFSENWAKENSKVVYTA